MLNQLEKANMYTHIDIPHGLIKDKTILKYENHKKYIQESKKYR